MNVGKRLTNWNFWSLLVNALCFAAVLVSVLFPGSWLVAPALVAPLLVVVIRQLQVIFRRRLREHGVGGAGRYVIGRYILLAGSLTQSVLIAALSPFWVIATFLAMVALEGGASGPHPLPATAAHGGEPPGAVAEDDRYPYWLVYPLNLVSIAPILCSAILPGWAVIVALVLAAGSLGHRLVPADWWQGFLARGDDTAREARHLDQLLLSASAKACCHRGRIASGE
ncbi:hypothetical protein [Brachybacterium sp. NPDC056505]|uniref:hypothetical protein n=1 Tax=Brachybacterium sp. NPDC056505 TaxID=3345843 RepID=UPI00366EBC5C